MKRHAVIRAIEYHLPAEVLSNDDLAGCYPEWTAEKIEDKLGVRSRRIAAPSECASDLGFLAARKLFDSGACAPADVDFLLFCSVSRDYPLPATACLIQDRLGLSKSIGALDYSIGCSGFVYGLGLAKGLIETGQARNVLLITAETISKYIHPDDRKVRTLFGDAGAATLLSATSEAPIDDRSWIGPFIYGTDGAGAQHLIVKAGGQRQPTCVVGNGPSDANLYMNGPEILVFTLAAATKAVSELLEKTRARVDDVDLFVFHQGSKQMLDGLRRKCGIPEERFLVHMRDVGNTASPSIPIVLTEARCSGRLQPGHLVMLVGFGVGLSWGATLVRWPTK